MLHCVCPDAVKGLASWQSPKVAREQPLLYFMLHCVCPDVVKSLANWQSPKVAREQL